MSFPRFCTLIESEILTLLPKHLQRPDGKLTDSERERLWETFNATCPLAWRLGDAKEADAAEKELRDMGLPDLLRIYEVALFLYAYVSSEQRQSVLGVGENPRVEAEGARNAAHEQPSQEPSDSNHVIENETSANLLAEPYDVERITRGLDKIVNMFVARIAEEREGRIPLPTEAPLGFFSFFDMWQDAVQSCVPSKI